MAYWISLICERYPAARTKLMPLSPTRSEAEDLEEPAETYSVMTIKDSETDIDALATAYCRVFRPLKASSTQVGDPALSMKTLPHGMWGRRFFTTKQGAIGTGPPSTLSGDKIAILAGGQTPFLLRKVKDLSHQEQAQSSHQEYQDVKSDFMARPADEEPWSTIEDKVLGTTRFSVKILEDPAKVCPQDWSLVGDCYAHGTMHAEWFQQHPRRLSRSIRIH